MLLDVYILWLWQGLWPLAFSYIKKFPFRCLRAPQVLNYLGLPLVIFLFWSPWNRKKKKKKPEKPKNKKTKNVSYKLFFLSVNYRNYVSFCKKKQHSRPEIHVLLLPSLPLPRETVGTEALKVISTIFQRVQVITSHSFTTSLFPYPYLFVILLLICELNNILPEFLL